MEVIPRISLRGYGLASIRRSYPKQVNLFA